MEDGRAKRQRTGGEDAQARIQELEQQLADERAGRAHDAAKLEFLGEKLRTVAERSKTRGLLLVRLMAAVKRANDGKAALAQAKLSAETADAELVSMLQQATAQMDEETRPPTTASAQPATEGVPVVSPSAAAVGTTHVSSAGAAAVAGRERGREGSTNGAGSGRGQEEGRSGGQLRGGAGGEEQGAGSGRNEEVSKAGSKLPPTFKIRMSD